MKHLIATLALSLGFCAAGIAADDLDGGYAALKTAVDTKKPAAEIKKSALDLAAQANKVIAAKGDDAQVKHAQEVKDYCEYALYTAAADAQPAEAVDLLSGLEQLNPKSRYMGMGYGTYIAGLTQTGQMAKVGPIAEKALVNFPDNRDLMAAVSNASIQKQQYDKALTYAKKALAADLKKPDNVADADWKRSEDYTLGNMHFNAGFVYAQKRQFTDANKELRAALPLVEDTPLWKQGSLFLLGSANLELGRQSNNKAQLEEALKFSEQAAAMEGPYQAPANKNVAAIKAQLK